MDLRRCELCDKPFVQTKGWEQFCIGCWKKNQGYALTGGDQAFIALQDAFLALEEEAEENLKELKELREAAPELRKELANSKALGLRFKAQAEENKRRLGSARRRIKKLRAAVLTQDRVNELIPLCHPDRHKGSDRATEVTKWLLSLRRKKDAGQR